MLGTTTQLYATMARAERLHERVHLSCFRTHGGLSFPLCLRPVTGNEPLRTDATNFSTWAATHRQEIESLLRKHGALLLRGFGGSSATAETFADFVEFGLKLPNFPYELGNAVRTCVVRDRVFTANESPPDKPIPWHHELAQTPSYPERILFYCDVPPEVGGSTPILLSTAVYEAVKRAHPAFIEKLEETGVIYSRVMTAHDRPESAIGRGWRKTFAVQSRVDAEKKLAARGYRWQWFSDDDDAMLREISPRLDGVKEVGNGEKKAFFNQMVAVWNGWRDEFNTPEKCVRYGDDTELDPNVMADVTRILNEHAVAIPWQKGDVLYIDNMQVQHSRSTFSGKRRVLASLANAPRMGSGASGVHSSANNTVKVDR